MEISFKASESLQISVEEREISIGHYLRQPQRLVRAIAEPTLTKQLSEDHFQLQMRPLNFMEIYHFQPTVVLKVWSGASGTVYLRSQSCEIKGIEYINNRFSINIQGKLSPQQSQGITYLQGKADLEVKVELPPPLWLTPHHLLEMAGNGLLRSVLFRIKQKLLTHLIGDYYQWVESNTAIQSPPPSILLKPES